MNLQKMLEDIYMFLKRLEIQIKLLPGEEFRKLLEDKSLDYTQRLYLCYFRYM